MSHSRNIRDVSTLEVIPSIYNIIYKKNKIKDKNIDEDKLKALFNPYEQVSIDEAIFSSSKEEFRCFQFRHLKDENNRPITQIRMINIEGVKVNYGEWQ